MLLRGELRKYAKNSNFDNFESPLYSTSVSMPLSIGDALNYTILETLSQDKNNLTLFWEKSDNVSIFDPCWTLKVYGGHLGNATICGISEKKVAYALFTLSTKSHTFNRYCTIMSLSCAYSCPTTYCVLMPSLTLPWFTTCASQTFYYLNGDYFVILKKAVSMFSSKLSEILILNKAYTFFS